MGDTFQAELALVLGVEGVVGLDESVEMVVKDEQENAGCLRDRGGMVCSRSRSSYVSEENIIERT
jgi:hypothetical protein